MEFDTKFLFNNFNSINTLEIPNSNTELISNNINLYSPSIIINCPITIKSFKTAYIDTNAFDNVFQEYFINRLNNSELFIDKILYFKYDNNIQSFENFILNLYHHYDIRLFLSSANSNDCLSLFNFLNNHNDVIFVSSTSTVQFDNKPRNLLRLSLQDNLLLDSLFSRIISNFYNLEKIIDNDNNQFSINTIYFIYTNDTYSNHFKLLLENIQSSYNNYNFIYLLFNNNTKNQIKNTIINSNSITDLFIIATLNPQSILDFFDIENMYNKFIFFTDPFNNTNLITKFNFSKAFIIIASDDDNGEVISSCILDIQILQKFNTNKQLNTLISFLSMSFPIIYKNLGNNLDNIITLLENNGIFTNGNWFSEYIGIFKLEQIFYEDNENNNNSFYNFMFNYYLYYHRYNPIIQGTILDNINKPTSYFRIDIQGLYIDDFYMQDNNNRLFKFGLHIREITNSFYRIDLFDNDNYIRKSFYFYLYKFFTNKSLGGPIPFLSSPNEIHNSVTVYSIDPSKISLFTQPERMTSEIVGINVNEFNNQNDLEINLTDPSNQDPINDYFKSSHINIAWIPNPDAPGFYMLSCIGGQFNFGDNNISKSSSLVFNFGNYNNFTNMIIPQEQRTFDLKVIGMALFSFFTDVLSLVPFVINPASGTALRFAIDKAKSFVIAAAATEILQDITNFVPKPSIPFFTPIKNLVNEFNRVLQGPPWAPNIFEINLPNNGIIKNYIIILDPDIEINTVTININSNTPNSTIFIEYLFIQGSKGNQNSNRANITFNSLNGTILIIKNLISNANNIGLNFLNGNINIGCTKGSSFNYIANNVVLNYLREVSNKYSIFIFENVQFNTFNNWVNNQIANWTLNYLRINNPNYAQYGDNRSLDIPLPSSSNIYYFGNITSEYIHIIRTSLSAKNLSDRINLEFNCNYIFTNSIILIGAFLKSNYNINIGNLNNNNLGYEPIINQFNTPFINSNVPINSFYGIYKKLILFGYYSTPSSYNSFNSCKYPSDLNCNDLIVDYILCINSSLNCFTIKTFKCFLYTEFKNRYKCLSRIQNGIYYYNFVSDIQIWENSDSIINCVDFNLLPSIDSTINIYRSPILGQNNPSFIFSYIYNITTNINIFGILRILSQLIGINQSKINLQNNNYSPNDNNYPTLNVDRFQNLNNNNISRFNNQFGNNHLIQMFNDQPIFNGAISANSINHFNLGFIIFNIEMNNSIILSKRIDIISNINITSDTKDCFVETDSIQFIGNARILKNSQFNNPKCEFLIKNSSVDQINSLTLLNAGFYVPNGIISKITNNFRFFSNDNSRLFTANGIPDISLILIATNEPGFSGNNRGWIQIWRGSLGNQNKAFATNQNTLNFIDLKEGSQAWYYFI